MGTIRAQKYTVGSENEKVYMFLLEDCLQTLIMIKIGLTPVGRLMTNGSGLVENLSRSNIEHYKNVITTAVIM